MLDIISTYFSDLVDGFIDPRKRVSLLYLFSTIVIALAWLVLVKRQSIKQSMYTFFSKAIWWSRSARLDYLIFLINRAIMMLVSAHLITQLTLAMLFFHSLNDVFGIGSQGTSLPDWLVAIGFTGCFFIVDDFSRYFVHRQLHAWPMLWAFHKVHHSAETLTPFTVFRTHPVEAVIFSLRSILVQAIMIAGFVYLLGDQATLTTVLGANVFLFMFNLLGSNLRHSHIAIGYWQPLEKIFFSPAQHQIHHSVESRHWDKNFGVVLAVWDLIGGSHYHSEDKQSLRYGLLDTTAKSQNLQSVYIEPFIHCGALIQKNIQQCFYSMFDFIKGNAFMKFSPPKSLLFLSLCFLSLLPFAAYAAGEVNVYSARKEALIRPILETFSEKTGIKVNLITGKADALLTRLRLEGKASRADVFITVDAGRLHRAKEAGVLQPIESEVLTFNIPDYLRDVDNLWFGLSHRARPIFYAPDRVDVSELSTYESLSNEKWKGRICMRSSNSVYNQSLVASMIESSGVDLSQDWANAFVKNFARPPAGGDVDQLKALAVGVCDVAIANTYYFGRLINSDIMEERKLASQLRIFWPNQADRGTHVNVSGAGVTKYSRNKDNAIELIEFLSSDEAQEWYSAVNNEYPVVPGVTIAPTLSSWGEFKADSVKLSKLGENNRAAVELMDRAGWK